MIVYTPQDRAVLLLTGPVSSFQQPARGTLEALPPAGLLYTPEPGFAGSVSVVADGVVHTVNVEVSRPAGTVALPTVAVVSRDAELVPELYAPSGWRPVGVVMPAYGVLTGTLRYWLQDDTQTVDFLPVTYADAAGNLAYAELRLEIRLVYMLPSVPDGPVAVSVPRNTALVIDPAMFAIDPDGEAIATLAFSQPGNGIVTRSSARVLRYMPRNNYSGADSFTITVGDTRGGIVTIPVAVTVTPDGPVLSAFPNGYYYRRSVDFPARKTSSETLSNPVVAIWLEDDAALRSVANGGHVESAAGWDIRVETDGGAKLDHDLAYYDPLAGTVCLYVRIPSWDISTPLRLWLYYGKPGLSATEANPSGTYTGFLAVWNVATGADVSGKGRSLTASGVAQTALRGPAGIFDGNGYASRSDAAFLGGLSAFHVTAVVQADAVGSDGRILHQGDPAGSIDGAGLSLAFCDPAERGGAANSISFALNTSGGSAQIYAPANVQTTSVMHIAAGWQSGQIPKLYIGGVQVTGSWKGKVSGGVGYANQTVTGSTSMVSGQPLVVGVGSLAPSRAWVGKIGQVRVANTNPLASRFKLEADCIAGTAFTIGDESVNVPNRPPVAGTIAVTTEQAVPVDVDVVSVCSDPDGDPLLVTAVQTPPNGTTAIVSNKVRYTPRVNFIGTDEFSFTVSDTASNTAIGLARVTVNMPAPPPSGGDYPTPLRTRAVRNATELTNALASAQPGDLIVLENGTYSGDFVLSANGTDENPIVVRARNTLMAVVTGAFTLKGRRGIVYGVHFMGANAGVAIDGTDNRVTRCKFSRSKRKAAVHISSTSTRARLDHCDITVEPFDGTEPDGTVRRAVVVDVRGSSVYARIDRNWFHDFSPKPRPNSYWSGFNTALIVTTTGLRSATPTETIVEYNLFENFADKLGAGVGTKGTRTTFRYNTFLNMQNFLELRAGWECTVWGNWFENVNHMTVRDADHLIANNRFIDSSGIFLLAGNQEAKISNDERCRALRARVARNVATVVVGKQYKPSEETYAAKDCIIEAHTGTISYGLHEGTVVRASSSVQAYTPVKLTRDDVGPFSP